MIYWYYGQNNEDVYNVDYALGYNEFDFFLENEEYRPCDGCKIEI